MNKHDFLSDGISVLTGGYAIANIEHILSIIILILSILNILYNIISRIIKRIKNKQYDEIPNEIEMGINQIQELENEEKERKK